jgi:hypothetical protein
VDVGIHKTREDAPVGILEHCGVPRGSRSLISINACDSGPFDPDGGSVTMLTTFGVEEVSGADD